MNKLKNYFRALLVCFISFLPIQSFANSVVVSDTYWTTSSADQSWGHYGTHVTNTCSSFTLTQDQIDQIRGYDLECTDNVYFPDGSSAIQSQNGNSCDYAHYSALPSAGATIPTFTCNGLSSVTKTGSKTDLDPDWYNTVRICAIWARVDAGGHGYKISGTAPEACSHPPPPPDAVVCTASSFTIDHGDLSPATFNGNEKSGTGSVKCTNGNATVKLYFSSPTISFSNGGKSSLTFSNGSTSEIVNASENVSTSFTVKSHLSSSGAVKTGSFSGSTTIITDIQ